MNMTAAEYCVHLRLHSEYDINKGIARLSGADSVIDYAAQLQQPALALTDSGCLFGAVKFYQQCRAKGIKPIIGCELKIDAKNDHHLLLLCANHTGYINLNRLLSRTYTENTCARAEWMTAENTEGIIALSGGARGDIGTAISRARSDIAEKRARDWQQRFPDRFYIEIWRDDKHDNNCANAAADIGQRLSIPVAATHPVQCTRAEDIETLNVKLCIAAGARIFDAQRPHPLSENPYLLSSAEMHQRFADIPGAMDNSMEIAKRCNLSLNFGGTHLPSLSQEKSHTVIQQEAEDGLQKKLGAVLSPAEQQTYQKRLDYELGIINKMNFADYFLIVMDFIRWAKNNGIPVGPGRGSGTGSLVAYALDITTLNPLEYDLLFERFLNPERISMPDFDIDFCVNGRDRVIRYVGERYGKEHVAQIVTFGTIGAKGAIRDVGRVLGIAYNYCDKVSRMIPNTPKITIEQALKDSVDFAEQQKDEEGKRLITMALRVEGLTRNIGTHAGGVLIAPRPLAEFCPLYAAADTNTLVSQYDMIDIEKIGLVKFDFLGLRTLTILADAEREIKKQHADFSLETIPLDDKRTYQLYSSGNSIGVFQCESTGMRELMKSLKPDRFTDIIALVALFRPGPLKAKMDTAYIARKHGKEEVSFPHECLTEVLADTYGLFIYQEQVMEIARRISGYSLGEADILRRAMGKKDEKKMASLHESFIDGSRDKLPKKAAEKLFNDMAQFAEYGFNKSHAATYALLSYRSAYLKTHYPEIFISAVLSAEADDSERVQLLLKDVQRLKIRMHPPDINASDSDFRANRDGSIQFGLKAIKGVGSGVMQNIVHNRGTTAFKGLLDFCRRASGNIPQAALELLVQAGAFDSLETNRAAVYATIPSALAQHANVGNLFNSDDSEDLADIPAWSEREKLIREQQALGLLLSGNFYQLYRDITKKLPLSWQLLDARPSENITIAGTFVRIVKRPGKKKGVFLLRDDKTELEILATRETMKILSLDNIILQLLIIRGKAFNGFRGISIMADSIEPLDAFLARRLDCIHLRCNNTLSLPALRALLPRQAQGKQTILLQYGDPTITFNFDLGSGWAINHETCQQLGSIDGILQINLQF
ncbi:MAG: DNA polymerase III subunit alpha [Proteobacteria bacterium]|nr:DNA polymerase III subunit alpha [Pseudomonadota bacterium]